MAATAKPAISTELPSQTGLINEASERILDVMNEAHVDSSKMNKKALSVLLAEESFKAIAPRYIATHKDLTMLLRYKDVLLTRIEEECKMLKHVNQKSEYEHESRVDQLEKLNSKLQQELLDVRCELVSCQKRLNFALARPPNSLPSSVVEASKHRRMDRYNTALVEYEKHMGGKVADSLQLKAIESENGHIRRGKTADREESPHDFDFSSRKDASTPLSKDQITYLKSSNNKHLPSLLTKDRFPNLPNINISIEKGKRDHDRSRDHRDQKKSHDRLKPESRSFTNADDIFEDRRKLRKDPSKRGQETLHDHHHRTEEPISSRNSSNMTDSKKQSRVPGLGNSQKLREELPSHGDNLHIDYHRFGLMGPPGRVKT